MNEVRRTKGSGTVVRIRGKFCARWRVGGESVYGPVRGSHEEADRDRLTMKPGTKRAGQPGKHPTLQEFAFWCMDPSNERFGRYGRTLAKSTFETNETIRLTQIEGSKLGRMKLKSIEKHHVQGFSDSVTKTVKTWKGGKVVKEERVPASPAYVRRTMAFVSKLFSLAVDAGYIAQSPAKRLELPEVGERTNRVLSPTEAKTLLNPERRIDAMILVALHTGMRRGEILGLQWRDVKESTINIPGTKTAKSRATIPLSQAAREAILKQPKRSVFVFCTENGKPIAPRNFNRDYAARKAQLGLPAETRFQDLRGTFGTILIESAVDLKTVQTLLRHSNPRTTMQSYLRSRTEVQEAAILTLEEKIGAKQPTPLEKRLIK